MVSAETPLKSARPLINLQFMGVIKSQTVMHIVTFATGQISPLKSLKLIWHYGVEAW